MYYLLSIEYLHTCYLSTAGEFMNKLSSACLSTSQKAGIKAYLLKFVAHSAEVCGLFVEEKSSIPLLCLSLCLSIRQKLGAYILSKLRAIHFTIWDIPGIEISRRSFQRPCSCIAQYMHIRAIHTVKAHAASLIMYLISGAQDGLVG